MITTTSSPDSEELSEVIFCLSLHTKITPLKLLEEMFQSDYLTQEDVGKIAPYLGLPYGQIRHIIEDI